MFLRSPASKIAAMLLVTLAVLAVSRTARAERAAVYVIGDPAGRAEWARAAEGALTIAGWEAVVPDLDEGPLADLLACVKGKLATECVPGYLGDIDADRALVIEVAKNKESGGDVTTVFTAWIMRRGGESIATDQRFCERCRTEAARDRLRELVGALVKEAKALTRPSTLKVTSQPRGAKVRIDGKEVGVTDLSHVVSSGEHTVEFELDGREPATRTVRIGDGDVMDVHVPLRPAKPGGDGDGDGNGGGETGAGGGETGSRLAPWLVVGTGAALAIGGGVLWALDEDPVGDDGSHVPGYRDTAPAGVALAATGVVAAAAGVIWLVASRDSAPDATPAVNVSDDGVTVGLMGIF